MAPISDNPIIRRLSWAVPPLFCVVFWWYGLRCWFRQDDFAWLWLTTQVHSWSDFWRAMFTPLAQGNAEQLYSHLVFAANGSAVDTTIVDGRVLMRGRQLLTLDEQEILRQANAAFQRVLARI